MGTTFLVVEAGNRWKKFEKYERIGRSRRLSKTLKKIVLGLFSICPASCCLRGSSCKIQLPRHSLGASLLEASSHSPPNNSCIWCSCVLTSANPSTVSILKSGQHLHLFSPHRPLRHFMHDPVLLSEQARKTLEGRIEILLVTLPSVL